MRIIRKWLERSWCRNFSVESFERNKPGKIATTRRESWTTLRQAGLIERKKMQALGGWDFLNEWRDFLERCGEFKMENRSWTDVSSGKNTWWGKPLKGMAEINFLRDGNQTNLIVYKPKWEGTSRIVAMSVLWAKELDSRLVFLRPLGLRLAKRPVFCWSIVDRQCAKPWSDYAHISSQ